MSEQSTTEDGEQDTSLEGNQSQRKRQKVRVRYKKKVRIAKKKRSSFFKDSFGGLKNRGWIYVVLAILLLATIWIGKDVVTQQMEYKRLEEIQQQDTQVE